MHVYLDNRSLGLSYMEQVAARKVEESGTYYFRQAVWSALMISSAINTMMILVESGPSLSLMFIHYADQRDQRICFASCHPTFNLKKNL